MAPRKGFAPFTRVFNSELLAPDKSWYVLTNSMCKGSPQQYFKKSPVVTSFPEEFVKIQRMSLRLVGEVVYDGKASSEYEIVATTFGLLAVLLRQKPDQGSLEEETFTRLKTFLNG